MDVKPFTLSSPTNQPPLPLPLPLPLPPPPQSSSSATSTESQQQQQQQHKQQRPKQQHTSQRPSKQQQQAKQQHQAKPHQQHQHQHQPKEHKQAKRGCGHQATKLWTEENDWAMKNMMTILKMLETSTGTEPSMATFCLLCRTATSPRLICLGCGGVFCYDNPDLPSPCFLRAHSSKPAKCHLGLDLICRELLCMVCGTIVQPDDQELKLLSQRLFPSLKRTFIPGSLTRTTSTIFPARGFRNLGNTCYMNVVLQVMLRIPELQAYLLTDHHNRLKHRATDEVSSCCACELVDILQHYSPLSATASTSATVGGTATVAAQNRLAESISPVGFLFALWVNSGDGEDFAGYRESDAHECLLACLNQLHAATQVSSALPTGLPLPAAATATAAAGTGTTTTAIATTTTTTATAAAAAAAAAGGSSGDASTCQCPIDLLFRCELTSSVVCGSCGTRSEKVDPLLDLSLEIGHLGHLEVLRLEDCLDSFTKAEQLNEKCYTCTHCQAASPDTTKALSITRLPHILCIQLKRFEHHGSASVKLDRFVKFPLVLDMKPYTAAPDGPAEPPSPGLYYRLTGIVRHQGNVASGHYQAVVYQDDQYFCFNDETVQVVTLAQLLKLEAYLLVYSFIS
ncbi:hypothetical protein PCANC_21364 [Puccinia coronata f. sp. avenae]|uniref:Ubiquitin carboxyl-terminal hydrolase n=1 Tax=Puccinia coronata f. sp. avenae TaxID=200324 RepID=A0A2N5SA75_9BASI|nr:hypothetical protein PCANC_21364 [Puccinia coronata f. sp. avenae]